MLNIDDAEFNSPLVVKPKTSEVNFEPEVIAMITSMGFTEKQSKKALNGKFSNYRFYT